jgi:hypothetical protein
MRPTILAACLMSTAAFGTAFAQSRPNASPDPAAPAAAPVEGRTPSTVPTAGMPGADLPTHAATGQCDRLAALIGRSGSLAGVTLEQAEVWKRTSNAQLCRSALERLDRIAGTGAEPAIQTDGAQSDAATPSAPVAPRVLVQQAQPEVTVRQRQPDVIVRMPPPVITVQQPQPEIIIRMQKPDVDVSAVRPDIRVVMPKPRIDVVPPQQAQAEPDIRVDGQPNVRVERTGEPKVIYRQAEGQPQVRFESVDDHAEATAAPQPGSETAARPSGPKPESRPEPQQTGALTDRTLQLDPARLSRMAVYGKEGDRIGDVDRVVTGPENRYFLVIAFGGFLGLGEQQALLPFDDVAVQGDRLVAENLTEDQAGRLPAFTPDGRYRDVPSDQTAPVRVLQ